MEHYAGSVRAHQRWYSNFLLSSLAPMLDHQVTYTVDTFLDKNKDTLSNDLKQMLQSSKDGFIRDLFPPDAVQSMKRPPTAGLQFRVSRTATAPCRVQHSI